MAKSKPGKKTMDREEYGYGFDIGVNDLDVIGQNNKAKQQRNNDKKENAKDQKHPS